MSTELAVINLKREMEQQNYILTQILEEMRKSNKMDKVKDEIDKWFYGVMEDENNFDKAPETIQKISNIIKED